MLVPEYAGAVLTTAGAAGTSGLTIDTDEETEGNYRYNYYGCESDHTTTQQAMRVAVQWKIPEDFVGWATATTALTIDFSTESITKTQSRVDVYVFEEGTSVTVVSATGNSVTAANNWQSRREANSPISITAGQGNMGNFAAGDKVVILLDLYSQDGDVARISDITFAWRA